MRSDSVASESARTERSQKKEEKQRLQQKEEWQNKTQAEQESAEKQQLKEEIQNKKDFNLYFINLTFYYPGLDRYLRFWFAKYGA